MAAPVIISSTTPSGGSVTITGGGGATSGLGGSVYLYGGASGSVSVGAKASYSKGPDVTFAPGKGQGGAPGGSVIWEASDGTELLRLNESGISLFGEHIPIAKVLKLLSTLNEKQCTCNTAQLMMAGCKCGGN